MGVQGNIRSNVCDIDFTGKISYDCDHRGHSGPNILLNRYWLLL